MCGILFFSSLKEIIKSQGTRNDTTQNQRGNSYQRILQCDVDTLTWSVAHASLCRALLEASVVETAPQGTGNKTGNSIMCTLFEHLQHVYKIQRTSQTARDKAGKLNRKESYSTSSGNSSSLVAYNQKSM